MPIYEFYCSDCHTIYNFFSPQVDITKRPQCPQCGKKDLSRQFSRFSISRKMQEESEDELSGLDESKMQRAMEMMANEADNLDENDPKQAARFLRKLCDSAGVEYGPGMEEAIKRLESGEDPEQIEAELGDVLEQEDLITRSRKALQNKSGPPAKDETLYDL